MSICSTSSRKNGPSVQFAGEIAVPDWPEFEHDVGARRTPGSPAPSSTAPRASPSAGAFVVIELLGEGGDTQFAGRRHRRGRRRRTRSTTSDRAATGCWRTPTPRISVFARSDELVLGRRRGPRPTTSICSQAGRRRCGSSTERGTPVPLRRRPVRGRSRHPTHVRPPAGAPTRTAASGRGGLRPGRYTVFAVAEGFRGGLHGARPARRWASRTSASSCRPRPRVRRPTTEKSDEREVDRPPCPSCWPSPPAAASARARGPRRANAVARARER